MKKKNSTLKFLIVGESGVGKTSLLVRYCEQNFNSEYLTTIGVDFKIKKINYEGHPLNINIWDTAGQERFRNITKSFYKGAHAIILAYSITDPNSYLQIENWIEQIRETENSDITMILVGSKSDLTNQRRVSVKQGQKLAQKFDLQFIETSSKLDSNIDEVFDKLVSIVMKKGVIDLKMNSNNQTSILPLNQKLKARKNKQNECC